MKKLISIILILVLILSLVSCGTKGTDVSSDETSGQSEETEKEQNTPADTTPKADPIPAENLSHTAESYDDVLDALKKYSEKTKAYDSGITYAADDAVRDEAESEEAPSTYNAVKGTASSDDGVDYSTTNVQVEGIDEGDIVKTDGEYIYILRSDELIIVKADGRETHEVSRTTIGFNNYDKKENGYYGSECKYPRELYVSGDRLVVVCSYNAYQEHTDDDGNWHYEDTNYVTADIYDITDRTAPVFKKSLGQDGYSSASRLIGSKLYLISSYYIWNWNEDEPDTYIPRLYTDSAGYPIEANTICIPENISGTAYCIAAEYDISACTCIGSRTILGSSDTVYMSSDNIYVTYTSSSDDTSEPRTEDVYTVVDHTNRTVTNIFRMSVADGLGAPVEGRVDGYLDSQFSMDEYNGYLRLVTTRNNSGYTVYTDEKRGFVNYDWHNDQNVSDNCLYVLDSSMSIVGSVENLAEGERIYSARFSGDIAYFVTFKNVDPLFAADLSDPADPKILSALKIPGFSEYLHVWSDGLLFGLGYDTKENSYGNSTWTSTDGMKMTMFNVSDPADVTELTTLSLDYGYSTALYNHKAILISGEKNIIAFPTDTGYSIYGFDSERGFFEKATIECGWSWESRGVYIGSFFYVVGCDEIAVLNMADYTLVTEITLPYEEQHYVG